MIRVLMLVAVAITPGSGRVRYREQWVADLRDAPELGISRWQLAVGALRTAMQWDTRPSNASGVFVAEVASLTVALLVDSRSASWLAPIAIIGGFILFVVWRRNWGALSLIITAHALAGLAITWSILSSILGRGGLFDVNLLSVGCALISIACLVRFFIANRRVDHGDRAVPENAGQVRS